MCGFEICCCWLKFVLLFRDNFLRVFIRRLRRIVCGIGCIIWWLYVWVLFSCCCWWLFIIWIIICYWILYKIDYDFWCRFEFDGVRDEYGWIVDVFVIDFILFFCFGFFKCVIVFWCVYVFYVLFFLWFMFVFICFGKWFVVVRFFGKRVSFS